MIALKPVRYLPSQEWILELLIVLAWLENRRGLAHYYAELFKRDYHDPVVVDLAQVNYPHEIVVVHDGH